MTPPGRREYIQILSASLPTNDSPTGIPAVRTHACTRGKAQSCCRSQWQETHKGLKNQQGGRAGLVAAAGPLPEHACAPRSCRAGACTAGAGPRRAAGASALEPAPSPPPRYPCCSRKPPYSRRAARLPQSL
eukprot:354845-Chlamydomonas_euryale.AAC.3